MDEKTNMALILQNGFIAYGVIKELLELKNHQVYLEPILVMMQCGASAIIKELNKPPEAAIEESTEGENERIKSDFEYKISVSDKLEKKKKK